MSEPARHDDAWDKVSRSEKENRREKEGNSDPQSGSSHTRLSRARIARASHPGELGEWPIRTTRPGVHPPADRAGYALGSAVGRSRQMRLHLQDQVHDRLDDLRSRFEVIRGRTSENLHETASDLRHDARRNLREMRSRAQHLAHDYPIHFVLGAAGTAFAIGFLLGWWRQSE